MSKFDKWFKAQFGALPTASDKRVELDAELEAAERQVNYLRAKIRWADRIATAYRAALYAKNASPGFKS